MNCSTKRKTETSMIKPEKTISDQVLNSSSKVLLYQCDICEGALNNARSLEEHFKQIHKSNLVFACSACKIRFPKEDMLTQHKEGCFDRAKSSSAEGQIDKKITLLANDDNRSMKEEEDDIKEQLYECDICEIVMFDGKSLEAHYFHVHKSKLAFACNNCSKRYPKEDMLNQHIHRRFLCRYRISLPFITNMSK